MGLQFPSDNLSPNKARVIFRSYKWKAGLANLTNTKGSTLGAMTSKVQLYLPGNFDENFASTWSREPIGQIAKFEIAHLAEGFANKFDLGGIANMMKFGSGYTSLPGEFLTFKQGEPVSLNFTFELVPRNAQEAAAINQIVTNFKMSVFPAFNGYVLEYPDVWCIQFVGIKGPGFPDTPMAYREMALVGCVPSYGGKTSALTYEDQYPVSVSLKLTFQAIRQSYLGDK